MSKRMLMPAALACLTASAVVAAGPAAGAPAISHQPNTTCASPDYGAQSYGTAQVPYTNIDATPDGAVVHQMSTGTWFDFCSNTATVVNTNTWVYGYTVTGHFTGWVNKGRLVNIVPIN